MKRGVEPWMERVYADPTERWAIQTIKAIRHNGIAEPLRVAYAALDQGDRPFSATALIEQTDLDRGTISTVAGHCVFRGLMSPVTKEERPEGVHYNTVLRRVTGLMIAFADANNQLDARLVAEHVGITKEDAIGRAAMDACEAWDYDPVSTDALPGLAAQLGRHPESILHDAIESFAAMHEAPLMMQKTRLVTHLGRNE